MRLGDIVVSIQNNGSPMVVQYDFGKLKAGEIREVRVLNSVPDLLLEAVQS